MDKSKQCDGAEVTILEYSKNQDAFNFSTLERYFNRTVKWVLNESYKDDDWRMVFIGSKIEAYKVLDKLREEIEKRRIDL